MTLSTKEQRLLDAIEPKANADGIDIVTLEIVGAKKAPTIRVYVDTEDGVDFDVLTSTQAWISALLDEIDPFPGAYTLEVSSPGIDRPLRTIEHFKRFIGKKCNVRTSSPIVGRSNFKGLIESADGDSVTLNVDGECIPVSLDSIKRANVIGDISFK